MHLLCGVLSDKSGLIASLLAKMGKSAELLLQEDGGVKLIRRAERPKDYFATLDCFDIFEKLNK